MLAPIRTKFALPCAFAALLTPFTLATVPRAPAPQAPPVARAVFVTPVRRPRRGAARGRRGGRRERGLGGRESSRRRSARRALKRVSDSPAVADVATAETSSADAIISQGVALSGADALQHAGSDGSGVTIVVLDQAFGAATRLNALAGSELPPLERQHRLSFDAAYGLAGRDYNNNSSRHGEFVSEIVYDMAPGATYWFLNYHSPDEFGQAVDYITNVIRPQIVVHSNSFLFGPFDGTGWFARKVDAAAASGILWVNSAGNYRTRHWEGAWSDADGDGNLDVPGDGNAFRVALIATSRPACDISWAGATTDHRRLLHARALTGRRADHARARQERRCSADPSQRARPAARPARHMLPGAISSPGHLLRRRAPCRATSGTSRLTLYCRMDMSPAAQVTASSSPTPGDAAGAFSVGAFDATTLLPESYSSEGPTDDGRHKPDISAPTNVLITPGDPESEAVNSCGGTSCATPHVGGAAALLWPSVAADGGAGSVAQRVRDRLTAQALDMGTPARTRVFGAGRLRLDLAAPLLGAPSRANDAPCAAPSRSRCRSPTRDARLAAAHGRRQAAASRRWLRAAFCRPRGRRRASCPGRTPSSSPPPTRAATSQPTTLTLRVDNDAPRVRLRAPAHARARGDKVRISASVLDPGSGLAGRPRIAFGDGARAERLPPRAPLQAPGPLHRDDPRDRSRGQHEHLVTRGVRVPAARGGRAARRGVDWRRDHRRRHDGSRSRGGPRDTDGSERPTTGSCSSRASCC